MDKRIEQEPIAVGDMGSAQVQVKDLYLCAYLNYKGLKIQKVETLADRGRQWKVAVFEDCPAVHTAIAEFLSEEMIPISLKNYVRRLSDTRRIVLDGERN